MTDLIAKLESKFVGWKNGDVPKIDIAKLQNGTGKRIYLVNRPESTQSIVMAAYLTEPYGKISQPGLNAMNNILGGDFVSRLNMNLREDKHWSYGAGSFVWDAKAQRPFLAYVSVQMDKTKESIQEIEKEFTSIIHDKPVTSDEFNRVQQNMTLKLPGMWETNRSVSGSIVEQVKFNLKDDYYKTYDEKVRKLTKEELQQISMQVVKPEQVNWIIVGDKSKILDNVKELGVEIIELDPDGNIVK
jgi:predicted Zn-dependent peptidase